MAAIVVLLLIVVFVIYYNYLQAEGVANPLQLSQLSQLPQLPQLLQLPKPELSKKSRTNNADDNTDENTDCGNDNDNDNSNNTNNDDNFSSYCEYVTDDMSGHKSNSVLITDENNKIRWTSQCSFGGLDRTKIGTSAAAAGVVIKLDDTNNNCLEVIQPSNSKQVLVSDNNNNISWINQSNLPCNCPNLLPDGTLNEVLITDNNGNVTWTPICNLAGMGTAAFGTLNNFGAGIVTRLGTGQTQNDCLRTLQPLGPNQLLITDQLGNISWANQNTFSNNIFPQSNSNQVLITDSSNNRIWINQCDFSGMNDIVTVISNAGIVARMNTVTNCLKTVQPTGNNQLLVTDNIGNITWVNQSSVINSVLPPSTTNQVLITDNTNTKLWINQCDFAGMNIALSGILPGGTGLVVRLNTISNCLRTFFPSAPNQILASDTSGAIVWIDQSSLPTGIPSSLANQVFITDASNVKTWINQCDFAGMNNSVTSLMGIGIIARINTVANCLRTVQSTGNNQVLITDSAGNITWANQSNVINSNFPLSNANQVFITDSSNNRTWINQCDFAGMNTFINGNLPNSAGIVIRLNTTANCLRTFIPSGPQQILVSDNFGNIMWEDKSALSELPLSNPYQVLVTNAANIKVWIDQCSFSGLNTITNGILPSGSGLVGRLNTMTNCLTTFEPTGPNQILITNNTGDILWENQSNLPINNIPPSNPNQVFITNSLNTRMWIDQCNFAGLNNILASPLPLGSGIVINLNTTTNCLRTFVSSGPLEVLTTDSNGNISWINQLDLNIPSPFPPAAPNQVFVTDSSNTMLWINQCNFAGMNTVVSSTIALGVVVNTGVSNNCLRTVQPSGINEVLVTDIGGNITWISQSDLPLNIIPPSSPNQVLITDSSNIITWINQCSFAGLNDNISALSGANIGVVGRNGNASDCLKTIIPVSGNQVLVTDAFGSITWINQSSLNISLPSPFPPSLPNQVFVTDSSNTRLWINQCDFAGLQHNLTVLTGSNIGVVCRTGSVSDCLRTIIPTGTNQVLTTDLTGNILWIDQINLNVPLPFPLPGPNQVLITDNSSTITWIDQCSFDGMNISISGPLPSNSGLVIRTISSSECLRNFSPPGSNYVLVSNGSGNIDWILQTNLPGGMNPVPTPGADQVLTSNSSSTMVWVNKCNFAGMANPPVSISSSTGGLVTRILSLGSNDCLQILQPGGPNQVLVSNLSSIMEWTDQSDLPKGITEIITTDGITINSVINGSSTGPIVTLGLNGWEFVDGSKILRPTTGNVGKLGDSSHIIAELNTNTLKLYNTTNIHTIQSTASGNFTWNLPPNNPSSNNVITCNNIGNINYPNAPANYSVLITNASNTITWISQCNIAGLNTSTTTSFDANTIGSGIVVNSTGNNCLSTLTSPGPGYVLVINPSNHITWEMRSNFATVGSGITTINSNDGIIVTNNSGPVVNLSLDGWEITQLGTTRIWRPSTSGTGQIGDTTGGIITNGYFTNLGDTTLPVNQTYITNIGDSTHPVIQEYVNNLGDSTTPVISEYVITLGDASNPVNHEYLTTLSLFNSGNLHNITTSAASSYNWILPSNNPTGTTRLINCSTTGNVGYTPLSSVNQVLVTDNTNTMTWINQCNIAGLNSSNGQTFNASSIGSGIVMNNATSNSCLTTLTQPSPMPPTGAVLVISNTGTIQWSDRANFGSGGGSVTSVATSEGLLVSNGGAPSTGPLSGTLTLSLDGWEISQVGTTRIWKPTNNSINPGQIGDTTANGIVSQGYFINLGSTTTPIVQEYVTIIGDPTNPVTQEYLTTLSLFNGGVLHNIKTNATGNYNWTTPTGNPTISTRLITCSTSGNLGYAPISTLGQVLITDNSNNITWVNQCSIAGLNTSSAQTFNASGSGSGIVMNTAVGVNNCLTTMTQPSPMPPTGAVLVISNTGTIQWSDRANFGSGGGAVTSVTTSEGLLVSNGGAPGTGPLSGALTLSLDGWEITQNGTTRIWKPTNNSINPGQIGDTTANGIVTQGYFTNLGSTTTPIVQEYVTTLGDSTNPVNQEYIRTLSLYNNVGGFLHNINTSASTNYTWSTPATGNLSGGTTLVTCSAGNVLGYSPTFTNGQILVTNGANIQWINQCGIAGLNSSSAQIFNASGAGSGLVVNNASAPNNCLTTLTQPSPMPPTGAVLVISNTGIIQWSDRANFGSGSGAVSSVTTTDGILVNTGTGPSSGALTLSLDEWEIVQSGVNRIWRPKTGVTGKIGDTSHVINIGYFTNLGDIVIPITQEYVTTIGDSTHPVNQEFITTVSLYNNSNGFLHNITTSAINNFNWITPTSNPGTTSRMITCSTSGNLGYTPISSLGQILVTDNTNTITWLNQCNIAGLNTSSAQTFNASGAGSGIVMNTAIGVNNCLTTLTGPSPMPSTGAVLIISNTGTIQWSDRANFGSGNSVTSVSTSDGILVSSPLGTGPTSGAVTLSLDGWEIITGSKILRPKTQSGTATQGRLGDSGHIIFDISMNNMVLYQGTTSNAHTISTSAISSYTWTTPSNNPSATSIITVGNTGTLNYATPSSNQVLITNNSNVILWENICDFGGMNNIISSIAPNTSDSLILHLGTSNDCLRRFSPGGLGRVLITDINNKMNWIDQDTFGGINNYVQSNPNISANNGLDFGVIIKTIIPNTNIDSSTPNNPPVDFMRNLIPIAKGGIPEYIASEILAVDENNKLSFTSQKNVGIVRQLTISADGVTDNQVCSVFYESSTGPSEKIINGFGNQNEEIINDRGTFPSNDNNNSIIRDNVLYLNNPDGDFIYIKNNTSSGTITIGCYYYGNGFYRSVLLGNNVELSFSSPYISPSLQGSNHRLFSIDNGSFGYYSTGLDTSVINPANVSWWIKLVFFTISGHNITLSSSINYEFCLSTYNPPACSNTSTNLDIEVCAFDTLSNTLRIARYGLIGGVTPGVNFISYASPVSNYPPSYATTAYGPIREIQQLYISGVPPLAQIIIVINTSTTDQLIGIKYDYTANTHTIGNASPSPFPFNIDTFDRCFILIIIQGFTTYFEFYARNKSTVTSPNTVGNIMATYSNVNIFSSNFVHNNLTTLVTNVNKNMPYNISFSSLSNSSFITFVTTNMGVRLYTYIYRNADIFPGYFRFRGDGFIKHLDDYYSAINLSDVYTFPISTSGLENVLFSISLSNTDYLNTINVLATRVDNAGAGDANGFGNTGFFYPYKHRGELPLGIVRSGTVTPSTDKLVTLHGYHPRSSFLSPGPSLAYPFQKTLTLFAHGDGTLRTTRSVNYITFPWPVYKPIERFAFIVKDASDSGSNATIYVI
jgi:hypothetical protein